MSINIGQAHFSNAGEALSLGAARGYGLARKFKEDSDADALKAREEKRLADNAKTEAGTVEIDDTDATAEQQRQGVADKHQALLAQDQSAIETAFANKGAPEIARLNEQAAAHDATGAAVVKNSIASAFNGANDTKSITDPAFYQGGNPSAASDLALSKSMADNSRQGAKAVVDKTASDFAQISAASEQAKAEELKAVAPGSGKKYRFNGQEITAEQAGDLDKFKAEKVDRDNRGYGIESKRAASLMGSRIDQMKFDEAKTAVKLKDDLRQLGSERSGVEAMQAQIRGEGGMDAFIQSRNLDPATANKLRQDFGPTSSFNLDLRRANALDRAGESELASKAKKEAYGTAGLDAIAALYKNDGKTGAALYNLFPNGDTISSIQLIPGVDPKDPLKGAQVQAIGMDGKPRPSVSLEQTEDWILSQSDPKYLQDLVKQRRGNWNKEGLSAERVQAMLDRQASNHAHQLQMQELRNAGRNNGDGGNGGSGGGRGGKDHGSVMSSFENYKKALGDDVTPQDWTDTGKIISRIGGAANALEVAELTNAARLARDPKNIQPQLDPRTGLFNPGVVVGTAEAPKQVPVDAAYRNQAAIPAAKRAALADDYFQSNGGYGEQWEGYKQKRVSELEELASNKYRDAKDNIRPEAQQLADSIMRKVTLGDEAYQRFSQTKKNPPATGAYTVPKQEQATYGLIAAEKKLSELRQVASAMSPDRREAYLANREPELLDEITRLQRASVVR